ncbi:MAG: peptidoglycan editing factor PgeF [Oscillospiraceae bacterium]|nr:peptidoglycan editing factor PgeF [Oscillospiraceae bacterium]
MKEVQQDSLIYLCAENIEAPHCFTTRYGGVSRDNLASLNIGTRREDKLENVLKNYEILGNAIGFDPEKLVLTKQTHTDAVRLVTGKDWGTGLTKPDFAPCDGLVTNTPGTALVVFTADCTPILLWDSVTGAVGAVHAGWRGTATQIGAKAVEKMTENFGCDPQNICAAIGPNIAQCCFQTDADVPKAMVETFGEEAQRHIRRAGEKYYVNLKALNALSLERAGVTQIEISEECTMCNPQKYWSARVHGDSRGAQGAIIVCQEAGK